MTAIPVENPRITVYMPCHNYGRFLADAIDSVLRQTIDDWELIVIDDGSTDETPRVMDRYRGHPQIRLFTTAGIGLPAVSNFAIGHARGRYVVRLDADDMFDENILLVLGNHLDRDPETALVFPDYFLIDDAGEVFAHERRRRLYEHNHVLDMPPHGACTMIRRTVIDQVGGYREDLGAQDGFDLWTHVFNKFRAANVNVPLFYYRRHGTNLTEQTSRILSARRRIKRDAAADTIEKFRPLIAVIPCRRHYDFVTDLWKEQINGKSLLERDIGVCLSADVFDHIVVACDNPEAEDVVRANGDSRLHFVARDPKTTMRTARLVPTLERIVAKFDPERRGVTTVRYLQTPFVTADTLVEAVSTLVMHDADASYAVEEIHSALYRRAPNGLELINPRREMASDFDVIYRDAATVTATRHSTLASGSMHGSLAVGFIVSPVECFFIDSIEDLTLARVLANGAR